ncbi:hypothetical protein [Mesorhizobium sp. WSM3224]|uniref:hypothetical protein n=1 Tax=Mesorhizobium sp. WSM3224 TaxID=1040986 RepID=UPI0004017C17|nr:hypothetical protein [Mesorhizobium sp. WSM3224]
MNISRGEQLAEAAQARIGAAARASWHRIATGIVQRQVDVIAQIAAEALADQAI